MIVTMAIFTGEYVTATGIIYTLLAIASYILIRKIAQIKIRKKKSDKQITSKLSIGFYLGITNIIIL